MFRILDLSIGEHLVVDFGIIRKYRPKQIMLFETKLAAIIYINSMIEFNPKRNLKQFDIQEIR